MLSGLLKFILGFFLAIAVLLGSSVAIALYFMNRTAIPPAKPIFANDHPSLQTKSPKPTDKESKRSSSEAKPTTSPSATPSPTESALPPGAYRGRVTWEQGLSLRSEPSQDAERIGGVGFKEKVIILEESQDKGWQKIRLENSKQEGWIKIGNTERVEE